MTTIRRSMCLNVEGFMKNNRYPEDYNIFTDGEGRPMEPSKALSFLTTEKARGHKVIPCSAECGNPCKHADQGCTGFDFGGGGCPGYRVEE